MTIYETMSEGIQWLCILFMAYAIGKLQERKESVKVAEFWRPEPIEVYKDWVKTILAEASDELSAWETKFIADMEIRLDKNWNLTEAQANKLEQIYADKTK